MTATEVLQRMLDERGVEYQAYELNPFEKTTSWDIDTSDPAHEVCASFEEFDSGTTLLRFWNCTPEQAIAATLGSCNCPNDCTNSERTETCHDKGTFKSWGLFTCSNCSIVFPLDAVKDAPSIGRTLSIRYCPNCGRKVVDA